VDGSSEDMIAQAAVDRTACDSREEQEPKESLQSLPDQQSLAEHHHGEIERHTKDQDDGGSEDIARPVGGHTACDSSEDKVNSPYWTGRLTSHEDR
jgi:hypothetical protein